MGVFVVILALVIIASILFIQNAGIKVNNKECNSDSDCIPATCCHASACVAKEKAPDCKIIMCTEECLTNTLDCGQGSCICQNNKCTAQLK